MNKLSLLLAAAALGALGCSSEPAGLTPTSTSWDATWPPGHGLDAGVVEVPGTSPGTAPGEQAPAPAPPGLMPAGDGGSAGAVDGGGDGDGDGPLGLSTPRCGQPPFAMVRLGARDMMGERDTAHLPGVTITLAHCPEQRFVTGPDGRLMIRVSRAATSWIRFESPGHVPWVVGELNFADTPPTVPVMATMIPIKVAAAVVPGVRPDGALVYVEVQAGALAGPEACRTPDGVTVTVKDHPEASVLYRAAGSNAGYGKGSMTSSEGIALIAGLPASGAVELTASKPGCTYSLAYGDVNSRLLIPITRTPLAGGAIIHQVFNPLR